MKHLSDDDLILCYYGELERTKVQAHLNACSACRKRYDELRLQLDAIEFEPALDPGEDFPDQVWRKIRWRLPEAPESGWRFWFVRQPLMIAGAVAGLLVAAFLVGRLGPGGPAHNLEISAEARDQILAAAVADHLELSEMMLVELLNAPADADIDLSGAQVLAANLLTANRLYRQTAAFRGDVVLAAVLDELERVLIEIRHRSPRVSLAEWQALRQATDADGTLFRIRVLDSRLRDSRTTQRPVPARVL